MATSVISSDQIFVKDIIELRVSQRVKLTVCFLDLYRRPFRGGPIERLSNVHQGLPRITLVG